MNNVYFCGLYTPEFLIEKYKDYYTREAAYAGNIFYKGILKGFIKSDAKVYLTIPADPYVYTNESKEVYNDYSICYVKKSKINIINHIRRFYYNQKNLKAFIKENPDGIILFNALRIGSCISGLIICKIEKIKTIGIVTDVPGYRLASLMTGLKNKLLDKIASIIMNWFDGYVILSESMKEVIPSTKIKPCCVIEGVYDNDDEKDVSKDAYEGNGFEPPYKILYAGSLHKQYGIMNLVGAVQQLRNHDMVLYIYGQGDSLEEIKRISNMNKNISYCGLVSHREIVSIEKSMHVLVNPRPVEDEYVRYSFPSKNMEYLASGIPTILTGIPSLPSDYNQYAYITDNNSIESIANALKSILNEKDYLNYKQKAMRARRYILSNKNPIKQAQQIVKLHEEIQKS